MAIKDIQRVVDRSWHKKMSASFSFNLMAFIGSAYVYCSSLQSTGLSHEYSLIGGIALGAGGLVSIKVNPLPKGIPESIKHFAALYYLEKEFSGSLNRT